MENKISYPIRNVPELIGLSRTGLYRAINAGELETFKIGRRRMVTHRDVENFVELKKRQSQKARAA